MGPTRRRDAVGHAVLGLGLPPRLVGRVRFDRPPADTSPSPTRHRAGSSRSCRSCIATRSSRPTPRPTRRCATATPGRLTSVAPGAKAIFFGASYHADYATVLAAPDVLPAVSEAVVEYLADEGRAGRPASRSVGRRGPPPAAVRRPGRRRARRRVRPPRGRRGLDAQRRARGRLPGRPPAGRHRLRRLPRDPRQEGSPRDPAQDPAGGGRRRDPADRLDRPAHGPRGLHRPPPAPMGRRRALPADARRRCLASVLPPPVRGARPGRRSPTRVPDRRRSPDRGRDPFPDGRRVPLLQRRRRPRRARAVAGRGDDRGVRPAGGRRGLPSARLPPRRRALQVRVGRHRRADPAAARPALGRRRRVAR